MVPKVKDQIGDDSLMNSGTWAYLGSEKKESDRYLFWTSVNTDEIGPGKEIPVIIVTGDGKFYISKSTTAKRTNKGQTYVTIADHVPSQKQYKEYLSSGQTSYKKSSGKREKGKRKDVKNQSREKGRS